MASVGMSESGAGWVAGVDGGGTSLRAALADPTGVERLRRRVPSVLLEPGREGEVTQVIVGVVSELAREAGVALPLDTLCAGLAGAGIPATGTRIPATGTGIPAVSRRPSTEAVEVNLRSAGLARRVQVCSDAEVALDDAFPEGPGILLIAGTGSIALAREQGKGREPGPGRDPGPATLHRVGGWGPLLGDEGSGFALGLEGLRAVARSLEGRGPETPLAGTLLEATDAGAPEDLLAWVRNAGKGEMAALAPRVVAAADEGDPVADGIVAEAVDALVTHVTALAERIAEGAGPAMEPEAIPVALHGGLLAAPGGVLRSRVRAVLGRKGFPVRDDAVDGVRGALARARKLGEETG